MIKIGCVIFCDGILHIHYWIWENNIFSKKTVVLAEKAVKSRRKKNLHNEFVNPIKLHCTYKITKKNHLNIIKSLKAFWTTAPEHATLDEYIIGH